MERTGDSHGTVCVVGAGPAGIVTGKVLLEDGFDVTLFEKHDEVGGTWASHRRYLELQHQLGDGLAEFPDKPWGRGYADAKEFQSYFESYAESFGVTEHVEFQSEVVEMSRRDGEGWTISVEGSTGTYSKTFDYVAICSGLHHYPDVPDYRGQDRFEGEILHSCEVDDEDALADRDVVVIGGGKSAYELSVHASRYGTSSTHVFRQPHWMLPRHLLRGLVPIERIFYSRVGESLLPRYYNSDCVSVIDKLPRRIKDLIWDGVVTPDIIKTAGLDRVSADLVPSTSLPENVSVVGILGEDYVERVEEQAIRTKKDGVDRFERSGVHLESGEYLPADAVVFATGFEKDAPFVTDVDIDIKSDNTFRLYRSIVPPEAHDIGFIGWRQTFNNFLSMSVSAHWLSEWFRERLVERPTAAEMNETIDERIEWMEAEFPGTRGFDYHAYTNHADDELLVDMGLATHRRSNPVTEYFGMGAKPRLYSGLKEERDRVAEHGTRRLRDRIRSAVTP